MKFRPLNNYIQVEPILPEKKVGSILLTQTAQPQPTQGTVIAVGPGKVKDDLTLSYMPDVKAGDVVMFTAGALKAVKTTEGYAFIIEAESLLGVDVG